MDMSQSDSDAPAASPKAGRGRKVKSSAHVDSSDEADSDVEAPTDDNPYPLEGIYIDEADRRRCVQLPFPPTYSIPDLFLTLSIKKMTEIEREDIIGTRKDEINDRELRKQVAVMAKKSGGRADAGESEEDEPEEETRTTTRSRKVPGASSKKADVFAALKKSRADKGKKKEKKVRFLLSSYAPSLADLVPLAAFLRLRRFIRFLPSSWQVSRS
jgi:RNA polymerase-associated protein RTF1